MMRVLSTLRVPFLVIAILVALMIVVIQIGSAFLPDVVENLLGGGGIIDTGALIDEITDQLGEIASDFDQDALEEFMDDVDEGEVEALREKDPPGYAIAYMAVLDGALLFSMILIGFGVFIPPKIQGRLQGCVTLIFSFFSCLGGIVMIFVALAAVITMVVLFLAFPFGTIAYLVIYGDFPRSTALAYTTLLMSLKILFIIMLLLAHQRFIENKGLMLLYISSVIVNVVVTFIISLPPGIFVSIADGIAGIVAVIVGIIWLILLII
jgi:hypothetical protein